MKKLVSSIGQASAKKSNGFLRAEDSFNVHLSQQVLARRHSHATFSTRALNMLRFGHLCDACVSKSEAVQKRDTNEIERRNEAWPYRKLLGRAAHSSLGFASVSTSVWSHRLS